MSLPVALMPGTVLGSNYVIESLINSGGFGSVYRATDRGEEDRLCAIKETYDVTPAARRQALTELGILSNMRSEHLPRVYDAFEENGRFYFVMQLIDGENLQQLLKVRVAALHMAKMGEQEPHQASKGPCSEQEVLAWMRPLMIVLQDLHSRTPAIIHRDIKPANIILTPKQSAVLVDFGLTKIYDLHDGGTHPLAQAVSPGFSPIEQYTGCTDAQSDIYSLAATMYLLLTNRLPPAALARSVRDELLSPRLLNPALSLSTERILVKALSLNAQDRYRSMQELMEAFFVPPTNNANIDATIIQSRPSQQPSTPIVLSQRIYPLGNAGNTDASYSAQSMQPRQFAQPVQPVQPVQPMRSTLPIYPVHATNPTNQTNPAHLIKSTTSNIPPGYVLVPESEAVPVGSLPTPFGQGCLFGLLQALLSAVIVLMIKKEPSFYLATFIGLLFFTLAGFMTTRRGGDSFRGGWSGFWAGITSTLMFWVMLFIGLFILLAQRIDADSAARKVNGSSASNELSRAWRAIQPMYPHISFTASQSSWIGLVCILGGGLLLASMLGWLGGMFGTSHYESRRRKAKVTQRI